MSEALMGGPEALTELGQGGVVQRSEYTYELGWKTLKDFLQYSGINISPITPKQVFKTAYSADLIESEEVWINMLSHRNIVAHDYDGEEFEEVLKAIHAGYLPALLSLKTRLDREI